jgi:integrase
MGSAKPPGYLTARGGGAGPPWRVVLCVGGKPCWFGARTEPTLKYGTRNEVVEWMWRKRDELKKAHQREAVGLLGRVRFTELLRRYRAEELPNMALTSRCSYECTLRPAELYFVTKLGDPMLDQIHTAHVAQYLSWRRSHGPDGLPNTKPLTATSREKDRAVLHSVFAFADMLELREGNPVHRVPKIKSDAKEPALLTSDQYEALVKACEECAAPAVNLYIRVLGETGARDESEALWLRWEDIDFERGFVTIVSGRDGHRTKSGKTRFVPMTAVLKTALKDHFATNRFTSDSPWIFHHTVTRGGYKRGERVGSFRRAVVSAVTRANIALKRIKQDQIPDRFVMHDLRHRRVTTWLAEGQTPVDVQYWMGHSSITTTMGYYHHVPKGLRPVGEQSQAPAVEKARGYSHQKSGQGALT